MSKIRFSEGFRFLLKLIGFFTVLILVYLIYYFIQVSRHLDYEEAIFGYSHSIQESKSRNRFVSSFDIPNIKWRGSDIKTAEAWLEDYKGYPTFLVKVYCDSTQQDSILDDFWFRIENIDETFGRIKLDSFYLYDITSSQLKQDKLKLKTNVTDDIIPLVINQ